MIPEAVIASANEGKVKEIRHLASAHISQLFTLKDLDIELPDGLEAFNTYQQNAMAKASYVFERTCLPVLADDSGLEVAFLKGGPGVKSARYAPEGTEYANRKLLLKTINHAPKTLRKATFVCVLCWLNKDGIHYFEAKSEGIILEKEIGEHGFGYDPVFYDENLQKTYAQLSFEEKLRISHRGKALKTWIKYLQHTEGGT